MAGITGRSYQPFERLPNDLASPEWRGTKQQRDLAALDNNELLRRIAYDLGVNLSLQSLNLSFVPIAVTVLTAAPTLLIQASQFPRGYTLFNIDFILNASTHAIFLGGPDVSIDNGYPLPTGIEKAIFLRENVALYGIAQTANVSVRILQNQ